MNFFCPNKSCKIFLSNAIFPKASICPLCRSTLVMIEEKIDEVDWQLLNSLPYMIAYPLKQALSEKHYWSKINKNINYQKGICPIAEELHEKTYISFPICHYQFTKKDIKKIINSIKKVWLQLEIFKKKNDS